MSKKTELLEKFDEPINVLDKGFVRLVDVMGDDQSIVDAARVSYAKGTKSTRNNRGLIRYLMRHRHCYHPDMEVLTVEGWKKWGDCEATESFLIPDPKTHTFRIEELPVEVFDADEEMVTFESARMSFCVTGDHRMWFKGKYSDAFDIHRAAKMPKWGHFDPLSNYTLYDLDGEVDPYWQFVGFYLGDGSRSSRNTVTFHLKKERKKKYFQDLASKLGFQLTERKSATYEDAVVLTVNVAKSHLDLFDRVAANARAADKMLFTPLQSLNAVQLRGLYSGLIASDGSVKKDRDQIGFSSLSPRLIHLFEALSIYFGLDAHHTYAQTNSTAYFGDRTTLEARKKYFGMRMYNGPVCCATSSTGLLAVRGDQTKFGFVCGNTSPFEMCEIKVHIKAPIFVSRQIVRHRTANINEMSARYSEVPEEYYLPDEQRMNPQGGTSVQSSAEDRVVEKPLELRYGMDAILQDSFTMYSSLIDRGLARELARAVTPLGTYTQWYWKIDLRNLLHFIHLRADSHAQWEIRQYADALADIVKAWVPDTWEAFEDYTLNAVTLSGPEIKELQRVTLFAILSSRHGGLNKLPPDDATDLNLVDGKLAHPNTMSKGEIKEYAEKLNKVSLLAYDLWYGLDAK